MISIPLDAVKTDPDAVFARVAAGSEPMVVKTVSGDEVVLMPMSEFTSLQETAYLLSSPANAARLRLSLEQFKRGEVREVELDDLDE